MDNNTGIKRKDIPKTNKELDALFTLVVNKIKFINDNYDNIANSTHLVELQDAYNEIYWKKDENWNIFEKWILAELQEAYDEILEDDEENENYSLKTQIENLLTETTSNKTKIDEFILKVEGEYWENEKWEKVITKQWFFDKINSQIEKFDNLYEEIDERLESWSTSVELAWIFSKKVEDYKLIEQKWSNIFIIIIFFTLGYYALSTIWNKGIETLTDLFNFLLFRLPFFAFAVWLLIFISNRRAEANKLGESYKHKEVMARAYVWYKKSISELDTTDNKLLEKHMENLLTAMSVDSSEFLNSKWENHPFIDLFTNLLKKDLPIEISSDWFKFSSKK